MLAAHANPDVARAFFRVLNLVEPPASLLRLATMRLVLRHGKLPVARPAQQGTATTTTEQPVP